MLIIQGYLSEASTAIQSYNHKVRSQRNRNWVKTKKITSSLSSRRVVIRIYYNSEIERSKIKKLRLTRSPKKLANCNDCPSSLCPGRLFPFVSIRNSTSPKRKTPVLAKAKSKSSVHTPARPSSKISRPKKKLTVRESGDQSTKDACVAR